MKTLVRLLPLLALALDLALWSSQASHAQSAACQRIARQISALSSDGEDAERSTLIARQVQEQRSEAARIAALMRSMGCDFQDAPFGGEAVPQCSPLRQRLRAAQQGGARLGAQALRSDRVSNAARRQTLLDSYDAYGCTDPVYDGDAASLPDGRAERDSLFDPASQSRRSGVTIGPEPRLGVLPPYPLEEDTPGGVRIGIDDGGGDRTKQGFQGRQPVCVRVCDGFFFPTSGAANVGDAQAICQAQCPQTKTTVFLRAPGTEISDATDVDGMSYSSLPNALRYRTKTDETCSCRQGGQSWSATLKPAEDLIEKKTEDVIVTEKNADDIAGKLKNQSGPPKTPLKKPVSRTETEPGTISETPLRTTPRANVRIIDTNKARVP